MRRKNKLFCLIFVLCVTAMFSWGDVYSHERSLMGMLYHHQGFFPGSLVLKNKEVLKLSPLQEQKIHALLVEYRGYFIRHISDLKLLELELAQNVESPESNRKKVTRLIREIGKKKTDGVIRYSLYLMDVKEILTPEQCEFLEQLKRDMMGSRRRQRNREK